MRHQERGRDQQHREARRRPAPAPVREPPRDGCCDGAGDAGEREPCDAHLRQTVGRPGEQERDRGPEQAEGGEQRRMVERPPLQHRGGPGKAGHGQQQVPVADARHRHALRQQAGEDEAHDQQDRCGEHEHRAPGRLGCDEAGDGTRQHDAEHQAAHDVADHPPANGLRRQMRGVGHQDLHRHGAEADAERRREEQSRRPGQRRAEQGGNAGGPEHQDQAAVLHEVAERHDQQKPHAVADLGQGDDEAGGGGRQSQRRADQAGEGLRVIQVGDNQPARRGEKDRKPRRHLGRPLHCAGFWRHVHSGPL